MPESGPPHLIMAAGQRSVVYDLARVITNRQVLDEISPERWLEISQTAIRSGLGALLSWKLEQQGFPVPEPAALQALQASARIASFKYLIFLENQTRVNPALLQAGIPVIWLKGFALARSIYPLPHLRPMDDLDLLVPYEQRQAALGVLQTLGYHFPPQNPLAEKIGSPAHPANEYELVGGPSQNSYLDLHFRVLVDDRLLGLDEMEWFWQESEVFGQGPAAFRLLKPEAHLLYLCAHAILQHGEADFRLQRYYDLHLLALKPGFDWDLVVNRAGALGWTYALERSLAITSEFFETPIPQRVFTILKQVRQPEENAARARRLQGAGHRWEVTLLSMEGYPLIKRLRHLYYLALPPPAYMRSRYAIPPGRALFPYYLHRWFYAGREIANAFIRRWQ